MSSSIFNDHSSWDVSNMMFARVLEWACDVGGEIAQSDRERGWVEDFIKKVADFARYSPDVSVSELFLEAGQFEFWCRVLIELATRIYERRIGNQDNQTWQVFDIWAVIDLHRVLLQSLRFATDRETGT